MRANVMPLEEAGNPSGVQDLRNRIYAHFPEIRGEEWHASVYDWIYTHPLADHIHRWVAVAGEEVVGHLAAIPQYYRVGGERVVAYTPADYMALPGYGFAAFSLMKKFYEMAENHVACDMVPDVIALESRMGAEVAGHLDYAAKLLDVSRLPLPRLPAVLERRLRLEHDRGGARGYGGGGQDGEPEGPPPVRPRLPMPGIVRRALNAALQTVDTGLFAASAGRTKVVELGGFDDSFDTFFEKVAASVDCTPEKDSEFLRWRYGPESPQHPVTVLAASEGGELLGYAVLRVTYETTHGFSEAFIMDLSILPGHGEAARALLAESVRRFRQAKVPIVRYRYSSSVTSPGAADLARLGFFRREGRSNSLLVGFADERLQALARDIDHWSYNVGDGEATFWVP